ncbi:MAG: hypothetical protein GX591_08080 [Planctomycetes bacterium]|nr:hypothetical protein [Planctomycetota bacterium]
MESRTMVRPRLAAALAVMAALGGCSHEMPPLRTPYPQPRSLAVLPLLNQSPSGDVDTIVVTDTLVSELAQVEGLTVLPTNQPLKVLVARGQTHPTSLAQATEIAQALGVDGVIVGAVTDYRPYSPQKVGMTLQLIWVRADSTIGGLDPIAAGRQAAAAPMTAAGYARRGSQVQAVLDAAGNDVTRRVQAYATAHEGMDSPYGWRRYLVDSDAYMHFVCHEMIVRLLDSELRRITIPVRTTDERLEHHR